VSRQEKRKEGVNLLMGPIHVCTEIHERNDTGYFRKFYPNSLEQMHHSMDVDIVFELF
jgi:hypothetical protein